MTTGLAIRRHLRFSLRTLLIVVTLVACWLAYQVNWVQQRRAFLRNAEAMRLTARSRPTSVSVETADKAPRLLWLFGEVGREQVCLYLESEQAESLTTEDARFARQALRLFPETEQWTACYKGPDASKNWCSYTNRQTLETWARAPVVSQDSNPMLGNTKD